MSHAWERSSTDKQTGSSPDLPLPSQEFASSSADLLDSLRECRHILGDFCARATNDQCSPRSAPSATSAIPWPKTDFGDHLKSPLLMTAFQESCTQTTPRNSFCLELDAHVQGRGSSAIQESGTQTDLEEGLRGVDFNALEAQRREAAWESSWKEVEELKTKLKVEKERFEVATASMSSPPTPSSSSTSCDFTKRCEQVSCALQDKYEQDPQSFTKMTDDLAPSLQLNPELVGDASGHANSDHSSINFTDMGAHMVQGFFSDDSFSPSSKQEAPQPSQSDTDKCPKNEGHCSLTPEAASKVATFGPLECGGLETPIVLVPQSQPEIVTLPSTCSQSAPLRDGANQERDPPMPEATRERAEDLQDDTQLYESEIFDGDTDNHSEPFSDNIAKPRRPMVKFEEEDTGEKTSGKLARAHASSVSEAVTRRTSTATVVSAEHLTPVMCEVEYPWMYDRQLLFLTNVPEHVIPENPTDHVYTMQDYGHFEATPEELDNIVSYYFGDECRDNIKTAFYEHGGAGSFWKVVFNDLHSARAAMMLTKKAKKPNIYFVSPNAKPRRRCDIFISNFEMDDRNAVVAFLKSLGERPKEVTRFAADFDPKRPDSKKLVWRATYPTEEAAKLVHGLVALNKGKNDDKRWNCAVSYQPNPFTKGLLICFRSPCIPIVVLQKLQFYHPESDNIVEGFKYALRSSAAGAVDYYEKGDICYDDDETESMTEGQLYARLITQNWWYASLFWALIYASLALMDLYSNIILSASLFTGQGLNVNVYFRYNFILSFFGLQFFIFAQCWKDCCADIRFNIAHSGDIIEPKTMMDRVLLHAAAFTFSFVQIPGMVKAIVKTLHPWTNVQEKSAQKMFGSRTFIVSFPNAQMTRVSEQAGFQKQFPPIILSRFVLTLFKIMHAYETRSSLSGFLCIAGLVLWPLQFASFKQLIYDRGQLVEFLLKDAKALKLAVDDLKDLVDRQDYLSSKEQAVLATWRKHLGDFADLHKYNKIWDAMPWDFWITLTILILANCIIVFLQIVGVLVASRPNPSMNSGVSVRTLMANISAADINGDEVLSIAELASADVPMRKLAILLRGHLMET